MLNFLKKKSTIFWMTYATNNTSGDRRQYFEGKKTLKDLHYWVEEERNLIGKTTGIYCTDNVVVTDIGLIKENY